MGSGTIGVQRGELATCSNSGGDTAGQERLMKEVMQKLRAEEMRRTRDPGKGNCGSKGLGHYRGPGPWGRRTLGMAGTWISSSQHGGREERGE